MPRRPSLKECVAWALRVYRAALWAAEKRNWQRARDLTWIQATDCRFCMRHPLRSGSVPCEGCEAFPICKPRGARYGASGIGQAVCDGWMRSATGLRRYRAIIAFLEGLQEKGARTT